MGTRTLEPSEYGVGESGRADKAIDDAFPDRAAEQVLVHSDTLGTGERAFKVAVHQVIRELRRTRYVRDIKNPYAPGNEGQRSSDGESVLITFNIPGDSETAEERVDAPLATVAALSRIGASGSRSSATPVPTRRSARSSRTTSVRPRPRRFR